jgi:hypothetical protein
MIFPIYTNEEIISHPVHLNFLISIFYPDIFDNSISTNIPYQRIFWLDRKLLPTLPYYAANYWTKLPNIASTIKEMNYLAQYTCLYIFTALPR